LVDEFEIALFRFYLVTPNELAKFAQYMWAMAITYALGQGVDPRERRACDEAREAFLEKCREHFGLEVLFVPGEEALRRVEARM
jgi:hypothetical protein